MLIINNYVLCRTNTGKSKTSLSLNVSFNFTSEDLVYKNLYEVTINILPITKFEHIYHYCCHDLNKYISLNYLIMLVSTKQLGDVANMQLSKMCINIDN